MSLSNHLTTKIYVLGPAVTSVLTDPVSLCVIGINRCTARIKLGELIERVEGIVVTSVHQRSGVHLVSSGIVGVACTVELHLIITSRKRHRSEEHTSELQSR